MPISSAGMADAKEGKDYAEGKGGVQDVYDLVDPVFLAQSKLRRRHYDECIAICTQVVGLMNDAAAVVES